MSPYLARPVRTLAQAIADSSAAIQAEEDSRIARNAVAFMVARFKDLRRSARTGAQIAAYDREIAAMEAYLLRTSTNGAICETEVRA
jgi:hypothetical protein